MMTDPPGRVVAEAITDREVVGGRVDVEEPVIVEEDEEDEEEEVVLLDDELLSPEFPLSVHEVVNTVEVADEVVTGMVITTWTCVVTVCSTMFKSS